MESLIGKKVSVTTYWNQTTARNSEVLGNDGIKVLYSFVDKGVALLLGTLENGNVVQFTPYSIIKIED